jgi:uncharacterized membrane protein YphA (DoxX/SURF4 family)
MPLLRRLEHLCRIALAVVFLVSGVTKAASLVSLLTLFGRLLLT